MTVQEAIDYFGSKAKLAKFLGCHKSAISAWVDRGEIPDGRQYELEVKTEGTLRANRAQPDTTAA